MNKILWKMYKEMNNEMLSEKEKQNIHDAMVFLANK